MSEPSEEEAEDYLSPRDMRSWMRQEIRDLAKAVELRVQELTELVTAYSAGEITAKEADDRYFAYHRRWGEALPGKSDSKQHSR